MSTPPRGFDLRGRPCRCKCHVKPDVTHPSRCCWSTKRQDFRHPDWIPFDAEMPPSDHTPFLVTNHLEELILQEGRIGHLWLVSHAERRDGKVYITDGGLEVWEPTHWRPLNSEWFKRAD